MPTRQSRHTPSKASISRPSSTASRTQRQPEERMAAFRSLNRTDRCIVEVLSVIYDQTNRSALIRCLNKLGVREEGKARAYTTRILDPVLERLDGRGVIQFDGYRLRGHPQLMELVTRGLAAEGRLAMIAEVVQLQVPMKESWQGTEYRSYYQAVRDIRVAIYLGQVERIHGLLKECDKQFSGALGREHPYTLVLNAPFDRAVLAGFDQVNAEHMLAVILDHSMMEFDPPIEAFDELADGVAAGRYTGELALRTLATQHILRGESGKAREVITDVPAPFGDALLGWLELASGDLTASLESYGRALAAKEKEKKGSVPFAGHPAGLFCYVALLGSRDETRIRGVRQLIEPIVKYSCKRWEYWAIFGELDAVAAQLQGDHDRVRQWLDDLERQDYDLLIGSTHRVDFRRFMGLLHMAWLDRGRAAIHVVSLQALAERTQACGYRWFAREVQQLERWLLASSAAPGGGASTDAGAPGPPSLAGLFPRQAGWERALNELVEMGTADDAAARTNPSSPESQPRSRIKWGVRFGPGGSWVHLEPREQRQGRKGWSKGRPIALARLYERREELDFLTPHDHRICAALRERRYRTYNKYPVVEYEFDPDQVLAALVDHPVVFRAADLGTRIQISQGSPELVVERDGDELLLSLTALPEADRATALIEHDIGQRTVVRFTPQQRKVAEIVGDGLRIPANAQDRVLEAIAAITPMVTVQSDIGAAAPDTEQLEAESIPCARLSPLGQGLKVEIRIRPLGVEGGSYPPGEGGETVFAELGGTRRQATRDHELERKRAMVVVDTCTPLDRVGEDDWCWILGDPQECLELLEELRALGDQVIVEWPRGESFRVKHRASLSDLTLALRQQRDWLAVSGELRLDESTVLDLGQLLRLLEDGPGRFVRLDDGQFLALTHQFVRRLDLIRRATQPNGTGLRCRPVAVLALEELLAELGEQARLDRATSRRLARLREARTLEPVVPSTLRAELREYQVEGFRWMARLAHWGVGACLADDMGLGKTVQALALLLARAPDGPALVVAPTSVCYHWLEQIQRFAPTLRGKWFGAGDREQTLSSVGPFDVLVSSYGLLQHEQERLAAVPWYTAVLDEAQAIKNRKAKRSRAARSLQADFRLALTGTPVENRLDEIWALFRFVEPGLLGSHASFVTRTVRPVERDGDRQARHHLRRVLRPFILRRTKDQVLEDLPARTVDLVYVDLLPDEAAHYEALRRRAIERVSAPDHDGTPSAIQILAEITRLRRACCNASLVTSELELPSAKLAMFDELLHGLRENRRRALVFSQFVDHLEVIRTFLDDTGVAYLYLDGQVPPAERQRRVAAFQQGEGDLFLISLRAGGTGLDLTAADAVIHMDPWWNPAVEDQASDRVHRIGQHHPVNIYRLIAHGTIEERILALHRTKREMVHDLLEGTDLGGKLSTDELLQLIRAE